MEALAMCHLEAATFVRAHRTAMAAIARFACLKLLRQQQHQVAIMYIDSSVLYNLRLRKSEII